MMFDIQFTPAVFPGSEAKTDIIREAQTIERFQNVETIAHTRRIKRVGDRQVILPPNRPEWGAI